MLERRMKSGRGFSVKRTGVMRKAAGAVVESLEGRRLLSSATDVFQAVHKTDTHAYTAGLQQDVPGKLIVTRHDNSASPGTRSVFVVDLLGDNNLAVADIAVDGGGNIYVAGASASGNIVVKLTSAGVLDGSFGGGDGVALASIDLANAIAVSSDGSQIAVAGATGNDLAVAILDGAGNPDSIGIADTNATDEVANDVIIVGGDVYAGGQANFSDFYVARFVPGNPAPAAEGLTILSDNDPMPIIYSGSVASLAEHQGNILAIGHAAGVAMVRYDATTLAIDTTFNSDGERLGVFQATEDLGSAKLDTVLSANVSGTDIYVAGVPEAALTVGAVKFNYSGTAVTQDTDDYGVSGIADAGVSAVDFHRASVAANGTIAVGYQAFATTADIGLVVLDNAGTPASDTVDTQLGGDPVLTVEGEAGSPNTISITYDAGTDTYTYTINGTPTTVDGSGITSILVTGGSEGDMITIAASVTIPAEIHGGDGADLILSGSGDDILFGEGGLDILSGGAGSDAIVGGDDTDLLSGGAGRDLLIGSNGADMLSGAADEDILVGGYTIHDDQAGVLDEIRDIWAGAGDYTTRRTALSAEGYLSNTVDVFDDNVIDVLIGGGGQDWFLTNYQDAGTRDLILGRAANEVRTDIN